MSKPFIQIGTDVREMSDAEYAQWQNDCQESDALKQAEAERANARASALAKLAALGLTDAEIAALVA